MARGGRKSGPGRPSGPSGRSSAKLRVGEELRMKLSQLMLRELDDPRLDGVHMTRVEMTPDLAVARVFWRTTPGAAAEGPATEALKLAAGFLRRRVAATMRLKHVPQLEFKLDAMIDSGARIEDLLAGLAASRTARPMPSSDSESDSVTDSDADSESDSDSDSDSDSESDDDSGPASDDDSGADDEE